MNRLMFRGLLVATLVVWAMSCSRDDEPLGPAPATLPDVLIVGADAGDEFGGSVSGGGDFNGDGIDDIIVGAQFDDDGLSDSGAAFIFFGSATLTTPPPRCERGGCCASGR